MKTSNKYKLLVLFTMAISYTLFFLKVYNVTPYIIILLINMVVGYKMVILTPPEKRKKEFIMKGLALAAIGLTLVFYLTRV